jgi:hypothetical protein
MEHKAIVKKAQAQAILELFAVQMDIGKKIKN